MNYNEKRTVRGPGKSGRAKGTGNKQQPLRYNKCDVRLNNSENAALDGLAERYGVSRSDVMRRALKDYIVYATGEEEDIDD